MAINVSVQYNGRLLPDIILLTQCYYHRGTRLNAMKRFCICSLRSHLNVLTFFPPDWGMLRPALMGTKNLYENGADPFFLFFFDIMGTRMVQIRIAKSV